MKRRHTLEWEDLEWFPRDWRDFGTDYLKFIATRFDIYKSILPVIRRGIEKSGGREWLDCASGGGSALLKLAEHLRADYPDLKITMTDFYPNIRAFERTRAEGGAMFEYESKPIDATAIPPGLKTKFRTIFGAFHHFRPPQARAILQDAVDSRAPVAVFEPVGRNAISFVSMLFVIPQVLLFTPFIRPFRWRVMPFVYLLPLIPLYILWDGIASILRTYSTEELKDLIAGVKNSDTFEWEIGEKKEGPAPIYYLFGFPKEKQ